jgi:DNA-binding CsgD family transcriptional regulator
MSRELISGPAGGEALTLSRYDLRRGCLVVVRGPRGSGKTRLMATATQRRSRGQRTVPHVWLDGRAGVRRCGADEVLRVLREDLSRLEVPGLIESISALARLLDKEATTSSFTTSDQVTAELWKLFGLLGARRSTMIVVDDADHLAGAADLVQAARRPGCLVVAAVCDDGEPTTVAGDLVALADQVIDLRPWNDSEVEHATGGAVDPEVHEALRLALGPLYGNPATVLPTVAELRERGHLHAVAGRLHRRDASTPITLPPEHHLLKRIHAHGRLASVLVALVAEVGTFSIDELPRLAGILGEDLDACGRTVDRLVEIGALVTDGWGGVRCLCPALAASAAAAASIPAQRIRDAAVAIMELHHGMTPSVPAPTQRRAPRTSATEHAESQSWSTVDIRIVDLIAAGRTNRQVASALALSEKTVEAHLTRLFSRTGCRSRVELVAADAERRLGRTRVGWQIAA